MKFKYLLALALVLAAITLGTAGYLWHVYWGEGSSSVGSAVPEEADGQRNEKSGLELPIDVARGQERGAELPTEGWWNLSGTVTRPTSGAGDRALVVYALAHQADLDELIAEFTPPPAGDAPPEKLILGTHPVAADGTFTAAFPPALEHGHLLALGNYLFMPVSRRVSSTDEAVHLRPHCGARVSGTVREIPAGGGPAEPAAEIQVNLYTRPRGVIGAQDPVRRTATTDAGGHFELPALPLPGGYEIRASRAELATTLADVIALEAGRTTSIEITVSRGASVTGRVVDWTGAPVAGARVHGLVPGTVDRNSYGERETESADDGSFRLDALPAAAILVSADRQGLLESSPTRLSLVDGEVRSGVELTLEAGASIAGTLAWPDGRPAVAQEVLVEFDRARRFGVAGSNLGSARGAQGSARTDEAGSFQVRGLGRGPFTVIARAGGPDELEWTARAEGVAPDTAGIALVLSPPQTLKGRVLDSEGRPIEAFAIHAAHLMQTRIGPMARLQLDRRFEDPEGSFALEDLEGGQWKLYAMAEEYATSEPLAVSIADEPPEPLVFHLAPAARVSGIVLTPDGIPIPGATVHTDEGTPEWMAGAAGGPARVATATLDDGSFEIEGLAPGTVSLYALAAGYSRSPAAVLELRAGETTEEVQLVMGLGGTLTGEVFGSEGRPTAQALVQLIANPSFDIQFATCDTRGRFRFENLLPGTWQVVAFPSEERLQAIASTDAKAQDTLLREMRAEVVEILEGEEVHVVLGVPPKDPVRLEGEVTLGEEPVAGAILAFFREGDEITRHMRRARTDARGEFTAILDGTGWYSVQVIRLQGTAGGEASLEYGIEIPDVDEHRLTIELPRARIRGRVVGPGSEPVEQAQVSLVRRGAVATRWFRDGGSSQAITDSNGEFELDGLREGEYVLAAGGMNTGGLFESATHFGRVLAPIRLEADELLDDQLLRLEPPGRAEVRVLDPGGKPVAAAAIFARIDGGELLELNSLATTDSTGICNYDGLAPGRFTFSARRGDLASPESPPVEISTGSSTEVILRLEEATFLCVEAYDGEGRGVEAEVVIVDSSGREVQGMSTLEEYLEIAGEHGFSMSRRRFGPLPPGRYRVEGSRGGGTIEKKVTLSGRRERRLTLRFAD